MDVSELAVANKWLPSVDQATDSMKAHFQPRSGKVTTLRSADFRIDNSPVVAG